MTKLNTTAAALIDLIGPANMAEINFPAGRRAAPAECNSQEAVLLSTGELFCFEEIYDNSQAAFCYSYYLGRYDEELVSDLRRVVIYAPEKDGAEYYDEKIISESFFFSFELKRGLHAFTLAAAEAGYSEEDQRAIEAAAVEAQRLMKEEEEKQYQENARRAAELDKESRAAVLAAVEKRIGHKSQWARGVAEYARELIERAYPGEFATYKNSISLRFDLLRGAASIPQYSRGGCTLVHTPDILRRLMPKKAAALAVEAWEKDCFEDETAFKLQEKALAEALKAVCIAAGEHFYRIQY